MRLLNMRDEQGNLRLPYKSRQDNCEFTRDLILLWFSEHGDWNLKVNDETIKGKGYKTLGNKLNELVQLKRKKQRKNNIRRLVVWTNKLGLFKHVILLAMEKNFEKEIITNAKKDNLLISLKDDDVEFRSFDAIAGGNIERIQVDYKYKGSEIDNMETYIKNQPQQNWAHFRWTAAHCFESLFYRRLRSELTEEEKKKLNYEIITRKDNSLYNSYVYNGCKAGLIWISDAAHRKQWRNVESWDISQAYGGQFVKADDFPIGDVYLTLKPKEEVMKERWYAFVFEFDEKVDLPLPWIKLVKEDDKWVCKLDKPDIDSMAIMGVKFSVRPRIKYQFICTKVGYLNYNVRKLINDIYNERQELKAKGDVSEKFLKQMNEVIYGKGLQERKSKDENGNDIVNFRYFCPQISYHALAKTRLELVTMLSKLTVPVACDSDCIKFCSTHADENYLFEERNRQIKKELKTAGFPNTKIGTWKHEGLSGQFFQFEKKVYAYEDENGELVCKFAGCNKESVKKWLAEGNDMNSLLDCLKIPGGVIFKSLEYDLLGHFWVETKYLDYSLDKEEMEHFFQRQKIIYNCA